tara:strand:- start:2907 stop:4157 length:1251 start_codon:yes stop_codon:yes gene_type:complete
MHIFIFQTGEPLHSDYSNKRPMRAMNLSNAFTKNNHKVTLISSAFFHQEKIHRALKITKKKINKNLEIILIPSPGYKKNVSLNRLYDHFVLAINLFKYLGTIKIKPDLIFIGFPPIESAALIIWWARRRKIKTFLDVKDKWPDYFLTKFPNFLKPIILIPLYPYFILSKYAMNKANTLLSMSDSFINWAQKSSKRKNKESDFVLYLSPPPVKISKEEIITYSNWWFKNVPDIKNKFVLSFVGSLSNAFDFSLIKELASKYEIYNKKVFFIICGDGDEKDRIKKLFENSKNVFLPGSVNTKQIYSLMQETNLTLAPYINNSNFIDNLPNKILDSLYYSKPIISSLEGEVKNLILNYEVGCFCGNKSSSWFESINKLIENKNYYKQLSENAEEIYKKYFSYDMVYKKFVMRLESEFKK